MPEGEKDGKKEARDVDDQLEDGDSILIVDCHREDGAVLKIVSAFALVCQFWAKFGRVRWEVGGSREGDQHQTQSQHASI